jgi:hypothetical protein
MTNNNMVISTSLEKAYRKALVLVLMVLGKIIQVKVAIIGVTAGGVGLNLSAAQSVIFVELPKSASEMLQVWPKMQSQ